MTDNALVISTDGTVLRVALPPDADGRRAAIRALVGGAADIGRYHPGAHLHLNSARVPGSNLVAWAVASAWRGFDLGYDLHGPAVVTSSTDGEALPTTWPTRSGPRQKR